MLGMLVLALAGVAGADLSYTENLAVWIDAGNVTESGGLVQSWVDQSGNSHDATLNTGGPALQANVINGLPAVYYGGGASHKCLDTLGLSGSDITVFLVAKRTGSTGTVPAFSVGDIAGAGADKIIAGDYGAGNYSVACRYNAGYTQFSSATYNTGDFGITTWQVQTGDTHNDVEYWGNGTAGSIVAVIAPTNVIDLTDGGYTVGALLTSSGSVGYGFPGYVAEMLIYTADLTEAQRNQVGAYLATKYNIEYVPEPATMACMGIGGLVLAARRRRR